MEPTTLSSGVREVNQLLEDPEIVEFARLNSPYVAVTTIADCMGVGFHVADRLLKVLDLDPAHNKEPRAHDIAQQLGHLPVGTEISQWLGGTAFHLPSHLPGITRVTRHFSADDV